MERQNGRKGLKKESGGRERKMNGEKDGEREGGNCRRNGEMDVCMDGGMANGWRHGGLVIP